MKKVLNEWFISAPWGKIALISWGDSNGEPVLLVHGRQDSAATFIPLLELLPDNYYYVGLDFPGHGKSDPFPDGLMLMKSHFTAAIYITVEHLKWDSFVYIGHSMGSEQGLNYNVIYPNKIKKIILLDPRPSLPIYMDFSKYHKKFHEWYYSGNSKGDRIYSKRRALDAVMTSRGLTEEQAEIILSRNLTRIGDDLYKLSWDKRLKRLAHWNTPTEYFFKIYFDNTLPTLVVVASRPANAKEDVIEKMLLDLKKKNYFIKTIEGGHDLHFTHPERIAEHICWFLDKKFDNFNSKL